MKPQRCISNVLVHLLIGLGPTILIAARCESTAVENASLPRITANTNQSAAGVLSEGALTVELEIREGAFYPEDEAGPSLQVFAFGERGKQLKIPGPMIRVPQDTRINVIIHNLIARDVLIHGMRAVPPRWLTGSVFGATIPYPGELWMRCVKPLRNWQVQGDSCFFDFPNNRESDRS